MIKWSRCTYFHIFFTDLRDLVKTNCKLGKALHNQRCYGDQWRPCLFLRKNRIESKAPKTGLDFWRLTPQRKHLILYPKDSPLISYARCNVLVTVCISFCPGVGSQVLGYVICWFRNMTISCRNLCYFCTNLMYKCLTVVAYFKLCRLAKGICICTLYLLSCVMRKPLLHTQISC